MVSNAGCAKAATRGAAWHPARWIAPVALARAAARAAACPRTNSVLMQSEPGAPRARRPRSPALRDPPCSGPPQARAATLPPRGSCCPVQDCLARRAHGGPAPRASHSPRRIGKGGAARRAALLHRAMCFRLQDGPNRECARGAWPPRAPRPWLMLHSEAQCARWQGDPARCGFGHACCQLCIAKCWRLEEVAALLSMPARRRVARRAVSYL